MELPNLLRKNIAGEATDKRVELVLDIDPKLSAFEGHFDGKPILPGVVQLQWAIEFAKRYLVDFEMTNIAHIDTLKYQNVIEPGYAVTLTLCIVGSKIIFNFDSEGSRHSSGKIALDACVLKPEGSAV